MKVQLSKYILIFFLVIPIAMQVTFVNASSGIKVRDIARFSGVRSHSLVGYGLVVGLSGTGDSNRSRSTTQSIRNTLQNFGVVVDEQDIFSKNTAATIVTAELNPFSEVGDKLDVHVSSIGDARSLTGGTLLITPLLAINGETYGLAQGALTVGGYQLEKYENVLQKNHPTVGIIPSGGTVERELLTEYVKSNNEIYLVLNNKNFSTAASVVRSLTLEFPNAEFEAVHAGKIKIKPETSEHLVSFMAAIENVSVIPQKISKVVVNERTGVIVSGSDVVIDDVVISYGSLKLSIDTKFTVSQPVGFLVNPNDSISTQVTPETALSAEEQNNVLYQNDKGTNIGELVSSLQSLKLTTRDIISILQALKKSGGLHAELIIQ